MQNTVPKRSKRKCFITEPFCKHPREHAGKTYWAHGVFAITIAVRLLASSASFALHAIFPFIPIPDKLNLGQTVEYLEDRNDHVKKVI
tara:strand:- start:16 stop:279 length:264 start_codon:yes stop_codon:yes gene_type:complete